jgi:hypothetical protein
MEGKTVDLRFDDDRIQKYLQQIISDQTLYGASRPLVLMDIRRPAPDEEPQDVGLLTIDEGRPPHFEKLGYEHLEEHLAASVRDRRENRVFIKRADVLETPLASTREFITTQIDSLTPAHLGDVKEWSGTAFQRFVVIGAECQPLTPLQQLFFAHFLSELARKKSTGRNARGDFGLRQESPRCASCLIRTCRLVCGVSCSGMNYYPSGRRRFGSPGRVASGSIINAKWSRPIDTFRQEVQRSFAGRAPDSAPHEFSEDQATPRDLRLVSPLVCHA